MAALPKSAYSRMLFQSRYSRMLFQSRKCNRTGGHRAPTKACSGGSPGSNREQMRSQRQKMLDSGSAWKTLTSTVRQERAVRAPVTSPPRDGCVQHDGSDPKHTTTVDPVSCERIEQRRRTHLLVTGGVEHAHVSPKEVEPTNPNGQREPRGSRPSQRNRERAPAREKLRLSHLDRDGG